MSEEILKHEKAEDRGTAFQSEYAPLIDALYREEVLEARTMSLEDKFLAGEELFRLACEVTLAGIRAQNPGATGSECLRILEDRIRLGERLARIS